MTRFRNWVKYVSGFWGYSDGEGKYHRGKTLWDLLQLLIIPIMLALGTWWLSSSSRQSEALAAKERTYEDRLQTYLTKMEIYLLEKNLREAGDSFLSGQSEKPVVLNLAQIQTITALRSLDQDRQKIVLQFLFDADLENFLLVDADLNEIDLSGVNMMAFDLRGVNLFGADLEGTDLEGTDLSWVNLKETNLIGADLTIADLSNAWLTNANLSRAWALYTNLSGAHLEGADLRWADLESANLSEADLEGADLRGANLFRANLSGANLRGAEVTTYQLKQAISLVGAIMPDGSKHK